MERTLTITPEGIDYLTFIIENPSRSDVRLRERDILGIVELKGFGHTAQELIDMLASRPIERPLAGSRFGYMATIDGLLGKGYLMEL